MGVIMQQKIELVDRDSREIINIYCDEHAKYMNVFDQTFNMNIADKKFARIVTDYLNIHQHQDSLQKIISVKGDIVTLTGTVEGFFQGLKAFQLAVHADTSLPDNNKDSQKALYTLALELMTMTTGCTDPQNVNTLGDMYFHKLDENDNVRGNGYWHHERGAPQMVSAHKNGVAKTELNWLYRFSELEVEFIYKKEALAQYLMLMRASQNIDFLALLIVDANAEFHEKCPPADSFWGFPGYDALGKIIKRNINELQNELATYGQVAFIEGLTPELCQLFNIPTTVAVQPENQKFFTRDEVDIAILDIQTNGRNEIVRDYISPTTIPSPRRPRSPAQFFTEEKSISKLNPADPKQFNIK